LNLPTLCFIDKIPIKYHSDASVTIPNTLSTPCPSSISSALRLRDNVDSICTGAWANPFIKSSFLNRLFFQLNGIISHNRDFLAHFDFDKLFWYELKNYLIERDPSSQLAVRINGLCSLICLIERSNILSKLYFRHQVFDHGLGLVAIQNSRATCKNREYVNVGIRIIANVIKLTHFWERRLSMGSLRLR
jgi:hypothetical protein